MLNCCTIANNQVSRRQSRQLHMKLLSQAHVLVARWRRGEVAADILHQVHSADAETAAGSALSGKEKQL